jgi:hypothetical protein
MNRNEFETYLKGLPGETEFPVCSARSCPIAEYMFTTTGTRYAILADRHRIAGHFDIGIAHPTWAAIFIERFDSLDKFGTAAQALEILEGIRE